MAPIIHFPELATWGQQLANILPLAALLKFVDIEKKLHILELSGFCPLWNWPLTPNGARLLLSDKDTTDACCLDRDGRVPVLNCMDCKYGNFYPSSAPTTVRLFTKHTIVQTKIENPRLNITRKRTRKYTLHLFLVQPLQVKIHRIPWLRKCYANAPPLYAFVSAFGWIVWLTLLVTSAASALYIATGYLLLMPVTGFAVNLKFGGEPRELIGLDEPGDSNRLAPATNSLNSADWWAFFGPKNPVNGLLNRPLLRSHPPKHIWLAS